MMIMIIIIIIISNKSSHVTVSMHWISSRKLNKFKQNIFVNSLCFHILHSPAISSVPSMC